MLLEYTSYAIFYHCRLSSALSVRLKWNVLVDLCDHEVLDELGEVLDCLNDFGHYI